MSNQPRDLVLISHANPENNQITLWLAASLVSGGYRVWSDLTNLIGGEDFWIEAEEAIRKRAAKVVYVLSEVSNRKQGPLQELHLAKEVAKVLSLKDFVIPVHLEDLSYVQINIELTRVNAIPFEHGWADGLAKLLKKLEDDRVPRFPSANPDAFTSWWRSHNSPTRGVVQEPERVMSNWFAVAGLPLALYFHYVRGLDRLPSPVETSLPYPAFSMNEFIVTFSPANDVAPRLPAGYKIAESCVVPITGSTEPLPNFKSVDRRQVRDFVVRLMRDAWERMLSRTGVSSYMFADGGNSFFFPRGLLERDLVRFTRPDGTIGARQVVGRHTKGGKTSVWHFAIDAKPMLHPSLVFAVKPHVLFSDDGQTIWPSKTRLQSHRRSFCRNWWNAEWRDRILASMAWLYEKDGLRLLLSSDTELTVSHQPVEFFSPISYMSPSDVVAYDDQGYEDDDDAPADEIGTLTEATV